MRLHQYRKSAASRLDKVPEFSSAKKADSYATVLTCIERFMRRREKEANKRLALLHIVA